MSTPAARTATAIAMTETRRREESPVKTATVELTERQLEALMGVLFPILTAAIDRPAVDLDLVQGINAIAATYNREFPYEDKP